MTQATLPAVPADPLGRIESLFQALADRTRLRILAVLLSGEVCVCFIHESLGLPQPRVSRHLAYLRRAGLVTTRRDGQWVHYRLADLDDPVRLALRTAVTDALRALPEIRDDATRLATRQPCAPDTTDCC